MPAKKSARRAKVVSLDEARPKARKGAAPEMAAFLDGEPNRTNEHVDVARRLLELSGTIREAAEYMLEKTREEDLDAAAAMLDGVAEALQSVGSAVALISDKIGPEAALGAPDERIEKLKDDVTDTLEGMIESCLSNRMPELRSMSERFHDEYLQYDALLSERFRSATLM